MTKFDRFRAWVHATMKDEMSICLNDFITTMNKRLEEDFRKLYNRLNTELQSSLKHYIDARVNDIVSNNMVNLLKDDIDRMIITEVEKLKGTINYKLVIKDKKKK